MRRLAPLPVLAAIAVAVSASGCGGSSSSDPFTYMPKDAPVVIAIDTDLNSQQAKNVGKIIDKFGPLGSSLKQRIKQGIQSSSNVNFDTDIKPLLGNDLLVAIPDATSLRGGGNSPTIEAIKTKDAGKAKSVIAKGSTKVGSSHGADIYRDNRDGTFTALEGDTLIGADTRPLLDAALARHDGSDHMSKDDFQSELGDLDKNAIVRVGGDLQAILNANPGSAQARKIKWVSSLRKFGLTASAQSSSLAFDFEAQTSGLNDSDLPIASGSAAPPVVKRPGAIAAGLRDPQQIYNFVVSALQSANPQQFGQFQAGKQQIGSRLGVDIDKQLIAQLTGNTALSADIKNDFAARFDLKDAATFKTALAKLAKGLPALARQFGGGVKVSGPKGGFYTLTSAKTKKSVVFGVVGKSLVVGSDANRATQFAGAAASPVAGAKGSVVFDADTRTIVNQQLEKRGVPTLVQAFTGSLGELTGYLTEDTSSLRGNFTLQLK